MRAPHLERTISHMPLATFRPLIDQLKEFPAPPTLHLSGYGEPLAHPDFLEMSGWAKRPEPTWK